MSRLQGRKMSDSLFSPKTSKLEAEFLEEETGSVVGADATGWNNKCRLLHPHSGARRLWELGLLLLMLWLAIAEPLRMALVWVHTRWTPYDLLITTWLALDVVFNLCTGLVEKRRLILRPKEVATRYLRGWGPIDLLVVLPWTQLIGWPRASPCMRLLKLLRLTQVRNSLYSNSLRWLSVRYGVPSIVRTLLHFFFLLFVISHWAACMWIYLGKGPDWHKDDASSDYTQITWLSVLEADPNMQSPDPERWGQLYFTALYFSITTMSTIGYGDISPRTLWERVAALTVMIIGNARRHHPSHTANCSSPHRARPPTRQPFTARTFRRLSSLTGSPPSSMPWPTRTKRSTPLWLSSITSTSASGTPPNPSLHTHPQPTQLLSFQVHGSHAAACRGTPCDARVPHAPRRYLALLPARGELPQLMKRHNSRIPHPCTHPRVRARPHHAFARTSPSPACLV